MICFHHNDLDGRCAAAIVRLWNEQNAPEPIVFVELDYKDRVPVERIQPNDFVTIVDFSFKPEVMAQVLAKTERVHWCDHHKTAAGYDYGRELDGFRDFTDKGLAGCECTWRHFFPNAPVPRAVTLTGDRDAWRWEHGTDTAWFNQAMKIRGQSPESSTWEMLLRNTPESSALLALILKDGAACVAFRDSFCKDYANSYGFETEFDGYKAFAMGLYMFGSEAFGDHFKQFPLCLSFVFTGRQWTVGLYSETIDVGEIARKHGGGGHKGAAGFVCDELPFRKAEVCP